MFQYLCMIMLLVGSYASLDGASSLIVGIAGGSGSGKTTFAKNIQKTFPNNTILVFQDSYYKEQGHLTLEERAKTNFDHPDALDFALLREHLISLKNGHSIQQPIYNFHTHMREAATQQVKPADIILVDGILIFAVPEIRELLDIKLFVDADDDVRLLRRIERDLTERSRTFESVRDQYLATVKPMYALFVGPSKQYADMIVPHGGDNLGALALILARLQEFTKEVPRQLSTQPQLLEM